MSGITGLGTTYNLPNYGGILFALTPAETKFFSAIGGLSGGGQSTSKRFEWETFDLRNAGQNVALEGATAPTAQARARGSVDNVTQIHHEKVSVSYTKLGAFGQKDGLANLEPNPVLNEADWQIVQMLKQMARDINFSFLQGVYQLPTDNTTARKTRGLLAAITSNLTANATSTITGLSAATDTVTETATALANGDKIVFTDVGASTTLVQGRVYYVVSKATNTFKVATSSGGSAVTIGTATVAYRKPWTTTLTVDHVSALLQGVYDNGGIAETETAALIVNSSQKLALSKAFATSYGKFVESSRNVGGVNLTTIETDFGTLNVMLERQMPQDAIAVCSLEQCKPVYLETPGKGHFFAEPLAKTGASDDTQLYGEVGLAYGNEKSHGLLTGLAV
jgi:uncharacterized membrane protein